MKRRFAAALGAAHADTFYELGRVNGEIFALNADSIADNGGQRSATYYWILGSHLADEFSVDVDCSGKQVRAQSRRRVRSDLSPVRDISGPADWQKPDARAIGGILVNAVCALPSQPSKLKRTDAASTADYLRQAADEVLAGIDPSKRMIIIDRTTVGDCIFAGMPQKVKEEALTNVQNGRAPMEAKDFREQANKIGAKCSGRPESKSDSLIVGAALSIFQRYGVVARLADGRKIGEDHLAAAWNTASAESRAPLLERAAMLHDPTVTVDDIETAKQEAISRSVGELINSPRLKPHLDALDRLNDQQKRLLASMYFLALAAGEAAEGQLKKAP